MTESVPEQGRVPVLVICGPTASGKTALGIALAQRFGLEIVSADSRQVYQGMDIGTAKPSPAELALVTHHLIDVVPPDRDFSAADFVELGRRAIDGIVARGKGAAVVGGTGLYIRALLGGLLNAPAADESLRRQLHEMARRDGPDALFARLREVDPLAAARIHPRNLVRIIRALEVFAQTGRPLSELQERHGFADDSFAALKIGVAVERTELFDRIDRRVEAMAASGLLDEVRKLCARGFGPGLKAMQTIGYRECLEHLRGERDWPETVALIQRNTRLYAKRQLTWFRRDQEIIWVDSFKEFDRITKLIDNFYANLKERTWPRPHSTFRISF